MKKVKTMVLNVGKNNLEKLVKNFLVQMKILNKKLDGYKGYTLNKTDGKKNNVELANDMFDIHATFKKVAELYKTLDFLMWSRHHSDLKLWLSTVRDNKRLLFRAKKRWACLKTRYNQFYDDWQLGSLIPFCKDCSDYHCSPCPKDLGTPCWEYLK
jgi:hypothetical protein